MESLNNKLKADQAELENMIKEQAHLNKEAADTGILIQNKRERTQHLRGDSTYMKAGYTVMKSLVFPSQNSPKLLYGLIQNLLGN